MKERERGKGATFATLVSSSNFPPRISGSLGKHWSGFAFSGRVILCYALFCSPRPRNLDIFAFDPNHDSPPPATLLFEDNESTTNEVTRHSSSAKLGEDRAVCCEWGGKNPTYLRLRRERPLSVRRRRLTRNTYRAARSEEDVGGHALCAAQTPLYHYAITRNQG